MLLFPHMQACIQGYITYEGGGGCNSAKENRRWRTPRQRVSEKLRAIHRALASLHMWLMGKTRQIIVGRPTVHYNQNLKLLPKNFWTLLPVDILSKGIRPHRSQIQLKNFI